MSWVWSVVPEEDFVVAVVVPMVVIVSLVVFAVVVVCGMQMCANKKDEKGKLYRGPFICNKFLLENFFFLL